MKCSAYFGVLSEKRRENWDNQDTNPYEVLDNPICLEGKGHNLLDCGSDYFRERIRIDWSSFAWKSTSEEIYKFLAVHKTTLPWLIKSEEEMLNKVKTYIEFHGSNEKYGVVFIEEN